MTTIETPVTVNPAVALCVEQAIHHEALKKEASTTEERNAHAATVRALDKAGAEMAKGNMPRYVGQGVYYVESRTNAGVVYRIDLQTQTCNCQNGRTCWHLAACNVLDELRSAPHDAPLQVTMSGHEIESELDAMLVAEALANDTRGIQMPKEPKEPKPIGYYISGDEVTPLIDEDEFKAFVTAKLARLTTP